MAAQYGVVEEVSGLTVMVLPSKAVADAEIVELRKHRGPHNRLLVVDLAAGVKAPVMRQPNWPLSP
jgi:hypothetical protein